MDRALERFLDTFFFDGQESFTARYTVWGVGFMRDWDMGRLLFPRAHRALKGWKSAALEGSKEPAAWEAVVVGADALASDAGQAALTTCVALSAARAALVQFDTYARPNEILKIRAVDFVPPARRLQFWHVALNPKPVGREGDDTDLRRAAVGGARGAVSKQKTFDNTVRVADEPSAAAGRIVLRKMVPEWKRRAPEVYPMFNLSQAEYAKAWAWASKCLSLKTTITPHMMRHGGASADYALRVRNLLEIQERGQWGSLTSCQRYKT
jgi:hypothetical protein